MAVCMYTVARLNFISTVESKCPVAVCKIKPKPLLRIRTYTVGRSPVAMFLPDVCVCVLH